VGYSSSPVLSCEPDRSLTAESADGPPIAIFGLHVRQTPTERCLHALLHLQRYLAEPGFLEMVDRMEVVWDRMLAEAVNEAP